MSDMVDVYELKSMLRAEVEAAGGAKKWLQKNKITSMNHVLHMVSNGDAATFHQVLDALGYRRVELFLKVQN